MIFKLTFIFLSLFHLSLQDCVCDYQTLQDEILQDLEDNHHLDCKRIIHQTNPHETIDEKNLRLSAQWESDCAFEAKNAFHTQLKEVFQVANLYDVHGDIREKGSDDEADMCELIRALFYSGVMGEKNTAKIPNDVMRHVKCGGTTKSTSLCAANNGSFWNQGGWFIMLRGEGITFGETVKWEQGIKTPVKNIKINKNMENDEKWEMSDGDRKEKTLKLNKLGSQFTKIDETEVEIKTGYEDQLPVNFANVKLNPDDNYLVIRKIQFLQRTEDPDNSFDNIEQQQCQTQSNFNRDNQEMQYSVQGVYNFFDFYVTGSNPLKEINFPVKCEKDHITTVIQDTQAISNLEFSLPKAFPVKSHTMKQMELKNVQKWDDSPLHTQIGKAENQFFDNKKDNYNEQPFLYLYRVNGNLKNISFYLLQKSSTGDPKIKASSYSVSHQDGQSTLYGVAIGSVDLHNEQNNHSLALKYHLKEETSEKFNGKIAYFGLPFIFSSGKDEISEWTLKYDKIQNTWNNVQVWDIRLRGRPELTGQDKNIIFMYNVVFNCPETFKNVAFRLIDKNDQDKLLQNSLVVSGLNGIVRSVSAMGVLQSKVDSLKLALQVNFLNNKKSKEVENFEFIPKKTVDKSLKFEEYEKQRVGLPKGKIELFAARSQPEVKKANPTSDKNYDD